MRSVSFYSIWCYLIAKDGPVKVIAVCKQYQRDQEEESCNLCIFHKLVTGFPAGDDLIEQEHDMPAVKCGDGEDVHKRQDDGDNPIREVYIYGI